MKYQTRGKCVSIIVVTEIQYEPVITTIFGEFYVRPTQNSSANFREPTRFNIHLNYTDLLKNVQVKCLNKTDGLQVHYLTFITFKVLI